VPAARWRSTDRQRIGEIAGGSIRQWTGGAAAWSGAARGTTIGGGERSDGPVAVLRDPCGLPGPSIGGVDVVSEIAVTRRTAFTVRSLRKALFLTLPGGHPSDAGSHAGLPLASGRPRLAHRQLRTEN